MANSKNISSTKNDIPLSEKYMLTMDYYGRSASAGRFSVRKIGDEKFTFL